MITRAEIVARARAYINTPYEHQGRMLGVGIDCAGLVIKVAHDLGLSTFDIDGYSNQPDETTFRGALRAHMDETPFVEVLENDERRILAQPGDVLTFHFGKERHMGIVTRVDPLWIVHAWSILNAVKENPVDASLLLRVRGCYRYRGVA